jgi:hypothetical protein
MTFDLMRTWNVQVTFASGAYSQNSRHYEVHAISASRARLAACQLARTDYKGATNIVAEITLA